MQPIREAALARGIVIVGAGQAGGRAAETLRGQGFSGAVTLIGAEPHRPYERPSLSKEMLLDTSCETIAWTHADGYLEAHDIAFHPGVSATKLDRAARRLQLSDGREIDYGALVLATGARVRRLEVPGSLEAGCFYLRTLDDCRGLRAQLAAGSKVLVIGAGFIGLEVAAAAIKRGCEVTVVEAGATPIGRVAPRELGAIIRKLHVSHGVSFHFFTQVTAFVRRGVKFFALTRTGDEIEADSVIVGIGVVPNMEIAAEADIVTDGGIVVDEFGATSDPSIFAVGDVARHYNPVLARHVLLESWQNAQNQAISVARNLARSDAPVPYGEVPWFWSNQYDYNIQMYGLPQPGGEVIVQERPNGSWLLLQLCDDRIVYAAGVNAARALRPVRDVISSRILVPRTILANPDAIIADLTRQLKHERQLAH